MKIKILNQETINKIAAGEVIQRPASIIKELVENSIDAGSTHISVSVLDGGKREIKITDNGSGIAYDEIPLAFKRHATSKINLIDDLENIETMGFRGEALSSIAAVANVVITTKSVDEELGSKSIFENGDLINRRVCSFEKGTEIVVSDLFKTIPARLKFLKKNESEERHIRDIIQKLALSHPDISIEYSSDNRKIFQTSGSGNLLDAARSIFGKSFANHLYEFSSENLPMKVYGLIGDLDARRSYRDNQIFFINGRFIKSKDLSRAYEEEWEGKLMKHQYPSGIIFIELPPKMLDVNVHPQKTEIRILNKSLVMILFKQCLREALNNLKIIPETREEDIVELKTEFPNTTLKEEFIEDPVISQIESNEIIWPQPEYEPTPIDIPETYPVYDQEPILEPVSFLEESNDFYSELPQENFNYYDQEITESDNSKNYSEAKIDFKLPIQKKEEPEIIKKTEPKTLDLTKKEFIGQVFNTYLILQDPYELYFIDQHAAHEAILYEEFSKAFREKREFESQFLMFPEYVTLTLNELDDFNDVKEEIERFGFKVEVEEDQLKVTAVPLILNYVQPPELIIPLISYFKGKSESPEIGLQKIITASCKAAVKGGDKLSKEEIKTLLTNLSKLKNPYTCPHGRPIIRKQSEYELEKQFKRIV